MSLRDFYKEGTAPKHLVGALSTRSMRRDFIPERPEWEGSGFSQRFKGPNAFNDFIRSLRKPQVFFGKNGGK
jgi:hypothetical protein